MGKYLGAVLTLIVGVLVVIGMVAALGSLAHLTPPAQASNIGTTQSSSGTLTHVHLTLQTFPFSPYEDPAWVAAHVTGQTDNGIAYPAPGDNQDWVTYWPTTALVVPAHALVTIDIENYDSATPLLNPFYARPQGVQGNSITVGGQTVTEADPNNVSHTFTIHSIPYANNQPWLYVSVPVTGVDPNAKADDAGMPLQPLVTEFSFVTQGPGQYIWQCFDPCGSNYNGFGGPMSTKGYMSGTLTVQ
jgi:hypothetical protein